MAKVSKEYDNFDRGLSHLCGATIRAAPFRRGFRRIGTTNADTNRVRKTRARSRSVLFHSPAENKSRSCDEQPLLRIPESAG